MSHLVFIALCPCLTCAIGQYTLRDDIHLATPPPHPSEVPILNPNPLSTAPVPITAGVKLSLCCIKYRNNSIPGMYPVSTNQLSVAETRSSLGSTADYDDTASDKMSTSGTSKMSGAMPSSYASQSQFGMYIDSENNANVTALSAVLANAVASPPSSAKDSKKRKPKNNMAKSNSSFVSRITPHEHLAKRLSERHSEDLYYFANINRSFNWMDYASPTVKVSLFLLLPYLSCSN